MTPDQLAELQAAWPGEWMDDDPFDDNDGTHSLVLSPDWTVYAHAVGYAPAWMLHAMEHTSGLVVNAVRANTAAEAKALLSDQILINIAHLAALRRMVP